MVMWQRAVHNVFSSMSASKVKECPWKTMNDLEDLPEMWFCAPRTLASGLDHQSTILMHCFEAFEGGHLAKVTRSGKHEELNSSWQQCTVS